MHTEVSDFTIVVTNNQNQPIATLVRVFSTDTGVLLLIAGGHKNFKSYELLGSSIVTKNTIMFSVTDEKRNQLCICPVSDSISSLKEKPLKELLQLCHKHCNETE